MDAVAQKTRLDVPRAHLVPLEDLWQMIQATTKIKNRLPRGDNKTYLLWAKQKLQNIFLLRAISESISHQTFGRECELLVEGGRVRLAWNGNKDILYIQYADEINPQFNGGTHHPYWKTTKEAQQMLKKVGLI